MLIRGVKTSPLLDCIKVTIEGGNHSAINNIFNGFGEKKINICFEVQLRNSKDLMSVTICVDPHESERGMAIIRENYPHLDVYFIHAVNILSAFPYRQDPETAFLFFKTLEEKAVSVIAVSTSLSSISCLVRHDQCSTAKESLEKAFGLI